MRGFALLCTALQRAAAERSVHACTISAALRPTWHVAAVVSQHASFGAGSFKPRLVLIAKPTVINRNWAIIFGGIMTMLAFVPTFRNMRLFAIYALIGESSGGAPASCCFCFPSIAPAWQTLMPRVLSCQHCCCTGTTFTSWYMIGTSIHDGVHNSVRLLYLSHQLSYQTANSGSPLQHANPSVFCGARSFMHDYQ